MQRPILVICIDRDNDAYEKAKCAGPIIGRDKNIEAATALALADPEDPDANTMFYAVKLKDEFTEKGKAAEVVTLTGDKKLGYAADSRIAQQLDKVIKEFNPTSAMLVTDGAADEEVLPIIKSRIKIDSTKIVFIKQAKELEKTYFVLLEKLKDPHYSRYIIGVPALLILLFSLSSYFGFGWQPAGVILGVYLILKGFGIDDFLLRTLGDFRFSIERISWLGYIGGISLALIAVLVGYQGYLEAVRIGFEGEKFIAYLINGNAMWLFILGGITIITGKSIDAFIEKRKFIVTKYILYSIASILAAIVLRVGSDWVLNIRPPYVGFGDFLLTIIIAITLGYVTNRIIKDVRANMLETMGLKGKEVADESGMVLGLVDSINSQEGVVSCVNDDNKKFSIAFGSILAMGEKLIVKN